MPSPVHYNPSTATSPAQSGEDQGNEFREIGHLAVFSVTSSKAGNGVELLRDGSTETFWQSDGLQPHLITMQFQHKVALTEVQLYMDFKLDESYTPNKISVRVGNSYSDLKEMRCIDLVEPSGWIRVRLTPDDSPYYALRAFVVQVAILANHQNGRDTHMRQVRVYGPPTDPMRALDLPTKTITTAPFHAYATIR